jgi:hypothetical protein
VQIGTSHRRGRDRRLDRPALRALESPPRRLNRGGSRTARWSRLRAVTLLACGGAPRQSSVRSMRALAARDRQDHLLRPRLRGRRPRSRENCNCAFMIANADGPTMCQHNARRDDYIPSRSQSVAPARSSIPSPH